MEGELVIVSGVCLLIVIASLLWAGNQSPLSRPWGDTADCTGLVWHTLRVPTLTERLALWEMRRGFARYAWHEMKPLDNDFAAIGCALCHRDQQEAAALCE